MVYQSFVYTNSDKNPLGLFDKNEYKLRLEVEKSFKIITQQILQKEYCGELSEGEKRKCPLSVLNVKVVISKK